MIQINHFSTSTSKISQVAEDYLIHLFDLKKKQLMASHPKNGPWSILPAPSSAWPIAGWKPHSASTHRTTRRIRLDGIGAHVFFKLLVQRLFGDDLAIGQKIDGGFHDGDMECMCVYIYICLHTCMYIYIYMYLYICLHTYISFIHT